MVTMFGFVGVNIIGRSCSVRGRGRRALTSMNVNHYRVFQTNDDGYSSRGLARMNQAIVESKIAGDTIVVAPSKDQSACGQKLTLQDPISLERHIKRGKHWYSLDGTPADCAILALDYGGIAIDHPPSIVRCPFPLLFVPSISLPTFAFNGIKKQQRHLFLGLTPLRLPSRSIFFVGGEGGFERW